MQSRIQQAIALKPHPVALLWADQRPQAATEFKSESWGCIMWLAAGAAKGKTGVCSRETFGCFGGGVGMGFGENVIIPYAAGCQTIGLYPYREAQSASPRAVVGLTDLSARVYVKKILGGKLMSFAMPLALFEEMEANVEGSFLQRSVWQDLMQD